jgi:hypothetical protein
MIFQMSMGRPVPIVDRAVFNFLLWQKPYRDVAQLCCTEDGWAVHAGVSMDPTMIEAFRPKLLGSEPRWNNDEQSIYTSAGKKVCLFHQWDRTSYAKDIMKKYGA